MSCKYSVRAWNHGNKCERWEPASSYGNLGKSSIFTQPLHQTLGWRACVYLSWLHLISLLSLLSTEELAGYHFRPISSCSYPDILFFRRKKRGRSWGLGKQVGEGGEAEQLLAKPVLVHQRTRPSGREQCRC